MWPTGWTARLPPPPSTSGAEATLVGRAVERSRGGLHDAASGGTKHRYFVALVTSPGLARVARSSETPRLNVRTSESPQ